MPSRVRSRCMPLPTKSQCRPQCEQCEDPEKDARNLQPQYPGESHDWSPYRLAKAAGPAPQTALRPAHLIDRPGCGVDRLPGRGFGLRSNCHLASRLDNSDRSLRRHVHRTAQRCRLTAIRTRAFARGVRGCSCVHRNQQRLHRRPCPESKRTPKANSVHTSKCSLPRLLYESLLHENPTPQLPLRPVGDAGRFELAKLLSTKSPAPASKGSSVHLPMRGKRRTK
jgi:hypothetical protein